MSEILHIKHFGPIEDVNLELNKINIFIGDQGTGKSTVGKVYSLIKNFIYLIIFNQSNPEKERDETWQFEEYLNLFEIKGYLRTTTQIYYKDPNRNIEISYKDGKASINFKRSSLLIPDFNYIVAERVFVSTLSDSFFGLNQFGTKLPTLFNRFGNKFSTARKDKNRRNYKEILKVDYAHIQGVDSVILENGDTIPLSDASTGLQGTVPLLVVYDNSVEYLDDEFNQQRDNLLVIEEPELNLFPLTQEKLLNHIITNNFHFETINANSDVEHISEPDLNVIRNLTEKKYKNRLIITTHSPYILTALNNLIYAYEVGKLHKDKVEKLIPFRSWVNPKDVSVYLLKGGTAEDIMDKEDMMVRAEMIDGVSDEINLIYAKLGEIKYGS